MKYMGGKSRIAGKIAGHILHRKGGRTRYVEPFLGSGYVAARVALSFDEVYLSDSHPDLIMMWQAVMAGWAPPGWVPKDTYEELRSAPSSALRGFVGFGSSYGGAWFNGYANGSYTRNHALESSRSLIKKASVLTSAKAKVSQSDYRDVDDLVTPCSAVYLDPPYRNTRGYGEEFDHDAFWGVAERWAERGALVMVSEYSAPDNWVPVYRATPQASMAGASSRRVTEHLYMLRGWTDGL